MVQITYVFDTVDLDIDNISKPILDAMKGLVYLDDRQIMDLVCSKRQRDQAHRIGNSSELFDAYLQSGREFIIVRVSLLDEPEVLLE